VDGGARSEAPEAAGTRRGVAEVVVIRGGKVDVDALDELVRAGVDR
jgi:hypothetical protein